MADVRSLERTLGETLLWNKARINFLAKFLVALIQVRTVNLAEIANSFAGKAKADSHYKRIQRFIHYFEFSYSSIAIFIVKLMNESAPWILTLDRTNWKYGECNLNILMLGIVYKGVAFPICWQLLDKRGNSDTKERKALINEFITLFGVNSIRYLCADREFIGKEWFAYLRRKKIDFRIRIRENMLVPNARGIKRNAWQLFAFVATEQVITLDRPRMISGTPLYFTGMRLQTREYLIVLSPCYCQHAIADYANRWEIETLFGCLKSRGFRLEDTHLTELARVKKLIALLAIAFAWAHLVGEWLAKLNPIKIKNHGRKAKSIFRLGFDRLRRVLTSFESLAFTELCKFLSCT